MEAPLLQRYSRGEASVAEMLALTELYPTWAGPAIELLRLPEADINTETRTRLRQIVALNCTDTEHRATLAGNDSDIMARFYPPLQGTAATGTEDAIATFLETYGHSSPEEDRLLEQMIFNPIPDYGAVLAVDEEQPEDAAAAFVEAFSKPVESTPEPPKPQSPAPSSIPPQESSLSESLAKIYIKQGRYNKAYEIILHLYLNNPKKSIYFADQLRFLRKLMLISRSSDKENK